MHRTPTYPPAIRVSAAGLTLLVHGLFTLLLLLEESVPYRPLPPARRLIGMWIHLPLTGVSAPATPQEAEDEASATDRVTPAPPTRTVPMRSTTITVVTPPGSDASPSASTASVQPADVPVDWFTQSRTLAARAAEAAETEPSFSPPPDKMRRPCEPRDSSFQWKDKPPKPTPQINPLLPPTDSVKLGGARVGIMSIGIKLFAPKNEPNKHLFDDMKAGKTPYSSVPDPNYCD